MENDVGDEPKPVELCGQAALVESYIKLCSSVIHAGSGRVRVTHIFCCQSLTYLTAEAIRNGK